MDKIIIISSILLLVVSCYDVKNNKFENSEIKKEINLNKIIDSIETSKFLNNEFQNNICIIDRGYGILDVITKFGNFLYIKDDIKDQLDTMWVFSNKNKHVDNMILKEVFSLSNLLVKFCSKNSLLRINFSGVFQELYSDSNIFIFTTLKYDSTLSQIQKVDTSFYDYELYIHDNPHYLYTLIYKVNDEMDSKEFIELVQEHTVRKIKPNWYYYRSYEISDRIKMDYFLTKE